MENKATIRPFSLLFEISVCLNPVGVSLIKLESHANNPGHTPVTPQSHAV